MSLGEVHSLVVHRDARGRVVEVLRDSCSHSPRGRQIFLTTANPGQVKGNHYHERKTECFLVLQGSMLLELRDRRSGQRESYELDAESLQLVKVPPQITHALRNEGRDELRVLVYVDEVYDREDADTFSHAILDVRPS